jgi:hypothetical protein
LNQFFCIHFLLFLTLTHQSGVGDWSGLRNTVAIRPQGLEERSFWVLTSFQLSHGRATRN